MRAGFKRSALAFRQLWSRRLWRRGRSLKRGDVVGQHHHAQFMFNFHRRWELYPPSKTKAVTHNVGLPEVRSPGDRALYLRADPCLIWALIVDFPAEQTFIFGFLSWIPNKRRLAFRARAE